MKDVVFEINQNVEKLETLLASDIKDSKIIDLHIDICKNDIRTLNSIIEFEEACDNYEAVFLLNPLLRRIEDTLSYISVIKGDKHEF